MTNKQIDESFEKLSKDLADVIIEQNASMFEALEQQAKIIREVSKDIGKIQSSTKQISDSYEGLDKRLRIVEKYNTPTRITIRVAITIAASVGIAILLFFELIA